MINRRLTSAEAAEQLRVKPSTLYAYVSRGMLTRQRTPAGSTFDAQEVARLARSGRHRQSDAINASQPTGGGAQGRWPGRRDEGADPVFVTELSLISDGRLFYRGRDAVELSRSRRFEDVAEWLWTGQWPFERRPWPTPPAAAAAVERMLEWVGPDNLPVERFMLAVAAAGLADELRHDLSPAAIPIVGRGLIAALVESLPVTARGSQRRGRDDDAISARLWSRLSRLPLTPKRQAVLEAALVLSADHELAPSTLAARVAAAFRADPYAVVASGLGPASGSWRSGSSGAPSEVESLLAAAEAGDPERVIGERLRRTGAQVHGFGMPLYPDGDPRGAELLSRLDEVGGRPSRRAIVHRVLAIGQARGFPPPNVDLGLGALAFRAEMVPGAGQAIATLGKVAGWLAHAMEEYADPTRFRTRAAYIGAMPAVSGRRVGARET
jgi:citrate synthase